MTATVQATTISRVIRSDGTTAYEISAGNQALSLRAYQADGVTVAEEFTISQAGIRPVGGVWKTYGVDESGGGPLGGITVGNGRLVGKWWTDHPVIADVATEPFLCHIEIFFELGDTSSVDSTIGIQFPVLVDGSGCDILPALLATGPGERFAAPGEAVFYSDALGLRYGLAVVGQYFASFDGTVWDATHPGAMAAGDWLSASVTFYAQFVTD